MPASQALRDLPCKPAANSYRRDVDADGNDIVVLVVGEPFRTVESAQTALYDAHIEVPAGEYPLSPVTIGYQPTSFDDAYYFKSTDAGEGTLIFGGYRDETPGETIRSFSFAPYGYEVRSAFETAETNA